MDDKDKTSTEKDKSALLIEQIDKFKSEIVQHRQTLKKDLEEDFDKFQQDEEYKLLLTKADLTLDDEELENLPYPYRKTRQQREQEEAERLRKQEMAKKGFDWDEADEKGFVRDAFREDLQEDGEDPLTPMKSPKVKKVVANSQYMEMLEQPRKDFEQMIGEGLVSKVGVLLITIGVFTLLNVAEVNWLLNEYVRTLIGMGIAFGMLFTAHRLRQTNETFSSLFIYGSLAVFYYTTYLAYHEYGVVNQAVAFFLDSVITLVALALAVIYKRKSLAVLALVGAYATPFIVNADEDFSNVLFFGYLLMMNIFMAAVANYMRWQFINLVIFALTMLTLNGWIHQTETNLLDGDIFHAAMLFAIVYYIFFFVVYVLYTWRHGEMVYFPLVINTCIFYYTVVRLLYEHETMQADLGFYTFMIGLLNLGFTIALTRHESFEQRLINHVASFAAAMVTLAIFVQMEYHELNRYWAIEAAVFMGLAYWTNLQTWRNASALVMLLSFAFVFVNWHQTYSQPNPTMFFNTAVFATIITIVAAISSLLLLQKDENAQEIISLHKRIYMGILGGVSGLLIYVMGNVELQFHNYEINDIKRLFIGIYNSIFILVLWFVGYKTKVKAMQKAADYLVAFSAFFYIVYVHFSVLALRNEYLMDNRDFWAFALHYINVGLSVTMVILLITDIYKRYTANSAGFSYLIWLVFGVLLFHASAELDHLSAILFYEQGMDLDQLLFTTHRLPYSIVWVFFALVAMYFGMIWKIKDMRIIALSLFAVTLIKFFVMDFSHINPFARVLSLMVLGGVLIAISFMYTHLQKMVMEGEIDLQTIRSKFDREAKFKASGKNAQAATQHTPEPPPNSQELPNDNPPKED
jgi:uncharacterized membrane protein